ncbi:MAG TPA: DUF4173 domain-containing protein [Terriglobia bacterium]|nr:DUF4173 domain-containing protein [Terriglobia bacterium]
MGDRTRLGFRILAAALLLGITGDGLLRAGPWGLNFFLWTAGLVAALALLAGPRRDVLHGRGVLLLAPVILFAAAFTWHDSVELQLLNFLAVLIALALLVWRAQGGRLWPAGVMEYVGGGLLTAVNAALGPLLVLFDCIQWNEVFTRQSLRRTAAVGSGVLIACPLLLIFGGLFASADAVFQGMLGNLIHLISWNSFTHIFLTGFYAWIVAGFLRGWLLGNERSLVADRRFSFPKLGIVQTAVVLGSLDLLFFSFVIVQIRYLFGGAPLVGVTRGLTYAEYARRGFFELVTVSVLVLPLLLFADWVSARETVGDERLFRLLAGIQILLLFIIMASAFRRMRLYQGEYGLTEARLYPTAFMGWLAVVFIWLVLTVLRGHRERFAYGALIAGFLMIGALHAIDPNRLIARTNTARAKAGRRFDAAYLGSLSADAVPTLVDALPSLRPHDRCVVAHRILQSWPPREPEDWRSGNWSRSSAWKSVSAHWQDLQEAVRSQPKRPDGVSPCGADLGRAVVVGTE